MKKRDRLQEDTEYLIDCTFSVFDDLFEQGSFEMADWVLTELDPGKLGIDISVAVLAMTLCAKNYLKQRENFYERTANYLRAVCEPDRVEGLLRGLE